MAVNQIGPYRIDGHIGSGGMGTVYSAWDDRLQRRVAIKSIHPAKELSETRRERLRREAQAVASISHPAITQVHDILSVDGRDYIVMEYVEGTTLAAKCIGKQIAITEAIDIARQVAEGLAAAHAKGVVHRDLKADNIMIEDDGRVRILDFGLAKSLASDAPNDTLTEEGMVMGTSCSMSPEQVHGKSVDARSDLFSLGSLLYELVTGKHPFQGTDKTDTMRRVSRQRQTTPSRLRPDIPVELELIIERLLEKNRKKRPSSAKEIAIALAALLEGDPTVTSDDAALARITSDALRRRMTRRTWATIAATLFLAAASFAAWWWTTTRTPPTLLAVAVPIPTATVPELSSEDELFVDALRMAIVNAAASLEGIFAISLGPIDRIGTDPAAIALAVAADEVLTAECTPLSGTWRVTLSRLTSPDSHETDDLELKWSTTFEVPADDLTLMGGMLASRVRELFPGHDQTASRYVSVASSDQYAEHLRIKMRIKAGLDYERSFDELEDLRKRAPRLLEAPLRQVTLGRYLFLVTHDERYLHGARSALKQAQDLAPGDPRVHHRAAELALALGDHEDVRAALELGRELTPAAPWILSMSAELKAAEGKPDEAHELLLEMVRRRPTYYSMRVLAGHELDHGMPETGLATLYRALELAPDHPDVIGKIAQAELFYGDLNRSVELYRRVIEKHPNAMDWSNLSVAYMFLGNYQETAASAQEAIKLSPSHVSAILNLAESYELLGDQESAAHWYRETLATIESLPNLPETKTLSTASQCLAHLGQKKEAAVAIQRLLAIEPDFSTNHYTACLVHAINGEYTSAVVSAQRAVELGIGTRWFNLPWFDPLRSDPDFLALLGEESEDSGKLGS